ncbi:MAG: hypothetical protein ACK559_27825, partial [bacterium]
MRNHEVPPSRCARAKRGLCLGDAGVYRKLRAGPAGDQGGVKIEELPVASATLRQGAPISSRQC